MLYKDCAYEYACRSCASRYYTTEYSNVIVAGNDDAALAGGGVLQLVRPAIAAMQERASGDCTEQALAASDVLWTTGPQDPPYEGAADLLRAMPEANGIVADLNCKDGTYTVAVARSAAHVFALDGSRARVALTAARAQAEGLDNVTVIHADRLPLPLGAETCDLLFVVGAERRLRSAAARSLHAHGVIKDAKRVLKSNGTLVIGLDKRYFASVFPQDRFARLSRLLPRRPGSEDRRVGDGDSHTQFSSRRKLRSLARAEGFGVRLAYPLPSCRNVQVTFDQSDLKPGLLFYRSHILHYSTSLRRLAGLVIRVTPARLIVPVLPSFWFIATRGHLPRPLPGVVTGSPFCFSELKLIDWSGGELRRRSRLKREGPFEVERLVAGSNARRWLRAPLLRRTRVERERWLLSELTEYFKARPRFHVGGTDELAATTFAQAHVGLQALASDLGPRQESMLRSLLDERLGLPRLSCVDEHGDLTVGNLVVTPSGRLEIVDPPREIARAPVGHDSTLIMLDLLGLRRDSKTVDAGVVIDELAGLDRQTAGAYARMLAADLATRDPSVAAALLALAVLRHSATKGAPLNAASFLGAAAEGRLEAALRTLGFDERETRRPVDLEASGR